MIAVLEDIHALICNDLVRHPQLTLLLDLDGTLVPFAATPEAATLDPGVAALLCELQASGVQIVIVSGRPRANVDPLRAVLGDAWLLAEHGTWSCFNDAWIGPATVPEIATLIALFDPFERVPGVRLEAKSESVCVHWRLVPPALKEDLIAACDLSCEEWLETHDAFERLDGVEMLEIRRRDANKGRAVPLVKQRRPGARIIAIGMT